MVHADHQLDRRKFVLGLLFCSAAGVAAWRQPSTRLDYLGSAKLEAIVPETIGKWKYVTNSGLVVPPEDEMSDSLYSQLLTRVYSDGESPPVMLLIAQSAQQTGVLQVHRPEVCYPTGGFQFVADNSARGTSGVRDIANQQPRRSGWWLVGKHHLLDQGGRQPASQLGAAAHCRRQTESARNHTRRGFGSCLDKTGQSTGCTNRPRRVRPRASGRNSVGQALVLYWLSCIRLGGRPYLFSFGSMKTASGTAG